MEKNYENFLMLPDEELVGLINKNDLASDILINKYKSLVKSKARQYFIIGADSEDLIQEGMIGLYKAIRDYKPEKQTPFYSFAEMCITRQLITAIKAATRQKHIPLNTYISLNRPVSDEESDFSFIDLLEETRITSPEELLIGREEKEYIELHIGEVLSVLECRVLSLYLQGKTYAQIAKIMSKDEKSIDNAIQRVRKKVEKILFKKKLDYTT